MSTRACEFLPRKLLKKKTPQSQVTYKKREKKKYRSERVHTIARKWARPRSRIREYATPIQLFVYIYDYKLEQHNSFSPSLSRCTNNNPQPCAHMWPTCISVYIVLLDFMHFHFLLDAVSFSVTSLIYLYKLRERLTRAYGVLDIFNCRAISRSLTTDAIRKVFLKNHNFHNHAICEWMIMSFCYRGFRKFF